MCPIFTGTRSVSAKTDLHVIIGRRFYIGRDLYRVTVTLRSPPPQREDYTEISRGGYRNQTARRFLIGTWLENRVYRDRGSGCASTSVFNANVYRYLPIGISFNYLSKSAL